VWDASKNAMVWRSVVTSPVNPNPERNTRVINDSVERAFRRFPPNQN
jgi:hypothetical protein